MGTVELFTSTLDVSLPIVSIAFGMYGAMNDTRPKDGKLTRQGKIAIVGIILFGILTIVIKVGGLYQKIETQDRDRLTAIHVADSLKRRDSIDQVFKVKLDTSLHHSALLIGHLSKQTDTSLNRMQRLAKAQHTLVTNSIRTIQPLQPLRISIKYTLSKLLPEVQTYFNQLIGNKAALMASAPGTIVSGLPGNRQEPAWMEIRRIENPYFPKFVELYNDYTLHITGKPINLDDVLTMQSFKIRLLPNKLLQHPELQDNVNNFNIRVDFVKQTVSVIYATDVFGTFEDATKSVFSIYDFAGHYLSVLGPFQKGYTLDDVSFYTGGHYWHLNRFSFTAANYKQRFTAHQQFKYYSRQIVVGEIR
ncbi:hypothetical protein [Mucilaginibacter ginsenosidivorax]|uniref:Uncharacterized protein n=1 Tax=Mucilaginibacter ginsenosidivorax TaxID=862126 RepID=A0A5B8VWC8_9SPHI|nr:hypothetical protein [Mucilaginibacter ginsenosidivorax]QEC75593.1 hypothetical protein FSB76_06390 [Mucilaginibacter ginsenosidivorax]